MMLAFILVRLNENNLEELPESSAVKKANLRTELVYISLLLILSKRY